MLIFHDRKIESLSLFYVSSWWMNFQVIRSLKTFFILDLL
jgi:hypothetical protein